MRLSDFFELEVYQATDSQVRLALRDRSAGQVISYQGKLRGPECRRGRTLPSSFPVSKPQAGAACELLVTDPCYWSPRLPFLYRFELEVTLEDGAVATLTQWFGLRRWETFGPSLRLEGRRVVLRGGSLQPDETERLDSAYQTSTAVIVADPPEDLLVEASAAGVNVVADLRGCEDLPGKLRSLSWEPAVTFAIADPSPQDLEQLTLEIKLVQSLSGDSSTTDITAWASAVLIELPEAERPQNWLADCRRPVVARRMAPPTADLVKARAACDQFQAELAPEFDFAGYFVG